MENNNNETVGRRPKRKKGGCLKWAVIIVGALFLLGFCGAMLGDSGDESGAEEATEEVAEQTKETGEEISEEESEESEEESELNEAEVLEEVDAEPVEEKSELISSENEGILPPEFALSLMESSFEGIANVTYSSEDKAFLIEPTDQEIKTALILLLEGSTPEINASWELLKDSFVSASNSIKDSVGAGYQIHLLNPMNNENSLLIIIDGVVIYDTFSQ